MDGQVPDHIYIVLKQAEIHAHRIVIVNVPQSIGSDQLANLPYRACINERMVHHQDLLSPRGFINQPGSLIGVCRQRLFHQYVFAGLERAHCQFEV
jgi:hypothetical protein